MSRKKKFVQLKKKKQKKEGEKQNKTRRHSSRKSHKKKRQTPSEVKKQQRILQKKKKQQREDKGLKKLTNKNKKSNVKPMCKLHKGIFVIQPSYFPSQVFSLFWRENFLVGLRRKHLNLTIYFSFSLLNQTHFKKVSILIFSPKFFIHLISRPNKHILKKEFKLQRENKNEKFFRGHLVRWRRRKIHCKVQVFSSRNGEKTKWV